MDSGTLYYKIGVHNQFRVPPWLSSLSFRMPGFIPGSLHLGSVAGEVALRQGFLSVLQFSPVSIIPLLLHTHSFIYHPRCIMFFSQYFSFPLSVSFHHCSILIHLFINNYIYIFSWPNSPQWDRALFINHASWSHSDTTQSVGLLWLSDQPDGGTCTYKTLNTHNRQTSVSVAGFESAIPASERPQTDASDRAATGILHSSIYVGRSRSKVS